MKNADQVGNDRKTKNEKPQPRGAQARPAGKRKQLAEAPPHKQAAEASPKARDFLAKSIERAVAGQDFEATLAELDRIQTLIEHVPGMDMEAMRLCGALGLIEALETIRKPGYCESGDAVRERVYPEDMITLSVRLVPEDLRDLVNEIIEFPSGHGTGAGKALAHALELGWPHGDNHPAWDDLLLDAKSFTTEMNLKTWSARLVIVVPALRWRAPLNAMAERNGELYVTAPQARSL